MATTLALENETDRLYRLLPAMYRDVDAKQGYPLRGLLQLVNEQADLVHADIDRLWANFFIETCDRWAVPYIGELVGNRLLHDLDLAPAAETAQALFPDLVGPHLRPPSAVRTRADVAKTIHYRRRKGTVAMLEALARDVTGWPAHVAEFFQRLTWTQHLAHLRLDSAECPDLRRPNAGERAHGPFETATHTVDVRAIGQADGWYNLRNVGVFLWRLRSYPARRVQARARTAGDWRYTFSPLGMSAPLFAAGLSAPDDAARTRELGVPAPIGAAAFRDDVQSTAAADATALAAGHPQPYHYYGDPATKPGASLVVFDGEVPVAAQDIRYLNLGQWHLPGATRPAGSVVGIDVHRGRFVLGTARPAGGPITVSYHYGFSGDVGGGAYERGPWLIDSALAARRLTVATDGLADHATLQDALAVWAQDPSQNTIITILDDATYAGPLALTLAPDAWLAIEAATMARPHLRPDGHVITVHGAHTGDSLTLSGLLVEGGLSIEQDLRRLRLLHTTLVPARAVDASAPVDRTSISVRDTGAAGPVNTDLRIEMAFSIVGAMRVPTRAAGLWILDSIVDGSRTSTGLAIAGVGGGSAAPPATIERSTILGPSWVRALPLASETIFSQPVLADRRQDGCVRFSFVPHGSQTPRLYRCQPALETEGKTAEETNAIRGWLVPSFTALQYGYPGYAQLRLATPAQIRTGAEDGSEMGVFNHLKQPQRETNLRIRLDEYLPFGLDAGVIYVT